MVEIRNTKDAQEYLNASERKRVAHEQQKFNALGYDINLTVLTAVAKQITEQKFFELSLAEYVPILVGNGAWSDNIVTYRDFSLSRDFEEGVINTGSNNARLAESNSGVDTITVPVTNWAKQINYSIFDLQLASKAGNWDIVTSKEKSRKKNWDLGIQQIAFVGSANNSNVKGLLTQSNVNSNTSLITKYLSTMTAAELNTFVAGAIDAYRVNNERTAYPSHFIIPESDYNGLAVPMPSTLGQFPVPMLDYLLQAFKLITRNPNFKILPCSYADKTTNNTLVALNKNRYTLLNFDESTVRMDIPVDYSNTLQNTLNGFQFQSVGYGQFTGVQAYRERELLYFDF
jgi:Uncharacterized protein conserved in bacteria (DUF2184)